MAENDVLTEGGKIKLDDPACLLNRKPKKSILKMKHEVSQEGRDGHARFDEMNILATYHPADKDYGTMKIDEPKTPYHHSDAESEPEESSSAVRGRRVSLGSAIDPEELAMGLANAHDKPNALSVDSGDETNMTDEQKEKKRSFEKKRKAHYNEGAALKAHIAVEDDDDDEDEEQMES